MLMRSTGLGRTELEGDVKTLDIKADYAIIGVKTTEPVKWRVRVATNFTDILIITRLLIFTGRGWKFIFLQLFKGLLRVFKRDKTYTRPDDF